MIELLQSTWQWYVAGPLIALTLFTLLYWGRSFGISSTLRYICACSGIGRKVNFFNYNWKAENWNIVFVIGAVIGGAISAFFLGSTEGVSISADTVAALQALGVKDFSGLAPGDIFSFSELGSPLSLILIVLGGFFVGFGARWAGGCTSGHAITGLSNLQLPSLIAVIGFFIGGLFVTHLLYPVLFNL